jgi:hypothetical protein
MTHILDGHAVIRETAVLEGSRPIVAELHARYVVVRLKGHGNKHLLPWDKLLWICRHRDAEHLMRERANRRALPARRKHADR